jgi:CO/xanthine dehydrogenase Mo-binding subunit
MLSEQDDQIDPTGVESILELVNVETAVVCNAIFHATGTTIPRLPVWPEHNRPALVRFSLNS